jgi:SAM-dependent methyltransferase
MTPSIYLNGRYAQRNPGYHAEDSAWKARQIGRMLRKHNLTPRSVVEVGCGAGGVLGELQALVAPGAILQGYDISPEAIALASVRANRQLSFVCGDLLAASVERFDMLLCVDVLEHLDDYFGFLRQLLCKAASFMFHIPLDLSAQTVFRGRPIMRARDEVGHLHYFMKETALATLRDCGYEIVDWMYTPSGLDLAKTRKAKLMRVPRRILYAVNSDFTARILGGYSLLVLTRGTAPDRSGR